MRTTERAATFTAEPDGIAVEVNGARPDALAIRCKPLAEFLETPDQKYHVKGVIPDGAGTGTAYGPPGVAKSFLIGDLALNLSRTDADRPERWHGHRLNPKPVPCIIVVAEGVPGYPKRLRASLEHYGLTPADVLLEIVDTSVNLLTTDTDDLLTAIRDSAERIGKPGLIVIDTLAATMQGGDENNGGDMGAYLTAVRRLATTTGAFVMMIHHTGKDTTRGARGHSSLKGAVDVELEITRDDAGNRAMICRKVRDDADGEEIAFRLEVVSMGLDADGDPRTSCVVAPTAASPSIARRKPPTPTARHALHVLNETIADHGQRTVATATIPGGMLAVQLDQWRTRYYLRYGDDGSADSNKETARKYFTRARKELIEHGLIGVSGVTVWVIVRSGTP